MEREYISVQELARRLGVSPRAVHWQLKRGKPIRGVESYRKMSDKKTAAYLITPAKDQPWWFDTHEKAPVCKSCLKELTEQEYESCEGYCGDCL